MGGITGYVAYTSKRRWGTHWQKYGPTYLTVVASLLVCADQVRHVLQDQDIWPAGDWPGSSQYRSDCPDESFQCLSTVGWLFTIVFTYSGFILLMVGSLWNANIMDKLAELKEQWKALRSEGNDALTEEVPVKSDA